MKNKYSYPAIFIYRPKQEISVYFPDFDCATSGVDDDDALESARECLEITIEGMIEDGLVIPPPSPISSIREKKNEKTVMIDVPAMMDMAVNS